MTVTNDSHGTLRPFAPPPLSPRLRLSPTDDWMFSRPDQQRQNLLYGPFTLDACAEFSFLDGYDCVGECVWMNPPFANAHVFIEHYLACSKARDPMPTSAVLVLPKWRNAKWGELVNLAHDASTRVPSPHNAVHAPLA